MTKKELSQLYYLKKEITELQRKIKELESLATNGTSKITDMPRGSEISDKVGKNCAKIADLKNNLQKIIKQYLDEFDRLNNFITSIEDSQMRLILMLRYIHHLTWQQIAFRIGGHDEQIPRKMHNQFLNRGLIK